MGAAETARPGVTFPGFDQEVLRGAPHERVKSRSCPAEGSYASRSGQGRRQRRGVKPPCSRPGRKACPSHPLECDPGRGRPGSCPRDSLTRPFGPCQSLERRPTGGRAELLRHASSKPLRQRGGELRLRRYRAAMARRGPAGSLFRSFRTVASGNVDRRQIQRRITSEKPSGPRAHRLADGMAARKPIRPPTRPRSSAVADVAPRVVPVALAGMPWIAEDELAKKFARTYISAAASRNCAHACHAEP